MHRYFLFFELSFLIIMTCAYGWTAGVISLVFVILSAISNVHREEEQQAMFNQHLMHKEEEVRKECEEDFEQDRNDIVAYYRNREKEFAKVLKENMSKKNKKVKNKRGEK